MPKAVQMKDSLSESKLEELGSQLGSLPTAERFKQRAETDLWELFTGQSNPDDELDYEAVPERSKRLIGTVSSDDEETKVPWWLEEFKWQATSTGEEEISLTNISKFQNFVPEQTIIRKPELLNQRHGVSNDAYRALQEFDSILEELQKHIDFDDAGDDLSLPKDIFTMQEGWVQTTNGFRDWFNSLVNLCPSLNEQLTSLLMLNSKVKEDLAREILPGEVMESIEQIGLVNDGEIYNNEYFEPLKNILTYDWSVFDLQIPYVNDEYDHLAPLEAALFESWVENNRELAEEYKSYLTNQSIVSRTEYGRVALQAPITWKRGKSTFVTLSLIKDKSLSAESGRKGRELKEILEKHGVEDE